MQIKFSPGQRILVAFAMSLGACSRSVPPPSPDRPQVRPPDLTGASVMVLPAQAGPSNSGAGEPVPGLDREIAFWLGEMVPRATWVFPPVIERAISRSPSLSIRLDALAVQSFHRGVVEIVGDPLFGDLSALGPLVNARFALLPVAAAYVEDAAAEGRVEVQTALIDTRGGRVIWFGVVAGDRGPPGGQATASAARALAALFAS
jgi:hypothetical protein